MEVEFWGRLKELKKNTPLNYMYFFLKFKLSKGGRSSKGRKEVFQSTFNYRYLKLLF